MAEEHSKPAHSQGPIPGSTVDQETPQQPVLEQGHAAKSGITKETYPTVAHEESEKGHRKLAKRPPDDKASPKQKDSKETKLDHGYEEFDPHNAREPHLALADNDVPKNKASRICSYLWNFSIVSRWTVFIVPILGLLWIPGILGLTAFPTTVCWGVKLIWWSIWLSVAWGGWWASLAFSLILPRIARYTLGEIAVTTRRYIDWVDALKRYIATFIWTLVTWIAYQPLIVGRQASSASARSLKAVGFIAKLFFGIFLCAAVLLGEKLLIQIIAGKFHERSYAERIKDQKKAVGILATLYQYSREIPGRTDTLDDTADGTRPSKQMNDTIKKAMKIFGGAANTATTAFSALAGEIIGSAILQPDSPLAIVNNALNSANDTRLLARRLFYSFVKPDADGLYPSDIAKYFPSQQTSDEAFDFFDKDGNGDVTRDEMELACMECHREQLSIGNSMKDLDSAVGRLDAFFMSLYTVIVAIILAVVLDSEVTTLLAGAGTLVLGLSWLIGGSLSDLLTSIIFLFVQHPYDVGDYIKVEDDPYTVKEIRVLSTVFLDKNNALVQVSNKVLNDKFILNMRRSPIMSETFAFDVAFDTTFEQIETLRDKMLAFVKSANRDFLPSFDVIVVDFPDQEKISLTADIKYKSNWQQGALKAQRRNKWICGLKQCLADVGIYGPKGNPKATPDPKRLTLVPWSEAKGDDGEIKSQQPADTQTPVSSLRLTDKNAVILEGSHDVFGEAEQLAMATPSAQLPSQP